MSHLLDRHVGFVAQPRQQKVLVRIEFGAMRPTLRARSALALDAQALHPSDGGAGRHSKLHRRLTQTRPRHPSLDHPIP
jgi:hypothetical protein